MSDEFFFINPGGNEGDAHSTIQIGGVDGKPTHHTSANWVIKAERQLIEDRETITALAQALEKERERIRRLMRALTDEVTR